MEDKYASLDVEQKFAKVILDLRRIRPFYSAVYEAMGRMETNRIDTMAVTTNKMIYNKDYVAGLKYNEFLFTNLHEIAHVALMHVSRMGNRDMLLWNIAADLYVNSFLGEEFGLSPGKVGERGLIGMPKNILWCESLDINTDFVEDIYDSLEKQAEKNGYFRDHMSNSAMNEYHFEYTGSKSYTPINKQKFEINLDVTYVGDIINNGEDELQKENDNKKVLTDAKTRYEMANPNGGNEPGLLKFRVDGFLKSKIDWRKWLRKYCIKLKSPDSTFSNPDKRMYYQDAIYPGQSLDENNAIKGNTIKGVKICIDTSESLCYENLQYFLGQVLKLTKQYKVSAEVIAWDTSAKSCGEIRPNMNLQGLDLAGRGGTQPRCVFEYFDSKECKIKPVVTLMFTDGYWTMEDNSKWAKKYKNTLWILAKYAKEDFKPPFGLVTDVRYD